MLICVLDIMDVDPLGSSQADGKVLVYTSQEVNANPAMAMTHKISSELPPILTKLARKFSPIRSK